MEYDACFVSNSIRKSINSTQMHKIISDIYNIETWKERAIYLNIRCHEKNSIPAIFFPLYCWFHILLHAFHLSHWTR